MRSEAVLSGVGGARSLAGRLHRLLSPPILAALITLLGGGLRLYRYTTLSLWLDEGSTVLASRLPWTTVLGLHGAYDPHPPLYYTLVKAASLIVPEVDAGRLLSVVAGTLTIPVLYVLASRLAGAATAVGASLALALSPVHLWYSQEARQYAVNVLLVTVSYLALVLFLQHPRIDWAALYGVAVLLALYVEYSAVYALIPQVALGLIALRARGRRALLLAAAAGVAALGFLPWLPNLVSVSAALGAQGQYAVTRVKVAHSLVSLTGLGGNSAYFGPGGGGYFWGGRHTLWDRWPSAHWALVLVVLPGVVLGVVALARRSAAAVAAALGLAAGTIATAIAIGLLVSPGYIERSLLYVVPGWAILVGAAPWQPVRSRWLRAAGALSLCVVLAASAVSLRAIYLGALKQEWRELAADTAVAATFGEPVLTYPTLAGPLIDVYQPQAFDRGHVAIPDAGTFTLPTANGGPSGAVWLAYMDVARIQDVRQHLAELGYQRLIHRYYPDPLYLDLYALPGARLGDAVAINGQFAGAGGSADGWALPDGAGLEPDPGGGRRLNLTRSAPGESRATAAVDARADSLYTLDLQARSQLRSGSLRVFLLCVSASGSATQIAPDPSGATVPNDGAWHDVRVAALCPVGTVKVQVDLRSLGVGTAGFRSVTLEQATARTPAR